LLFAAIISFLLYDNSDGIIIISIVVLSAFLSFFQEKKAVNAMEKLLKSVQIKSTIIRSGQEKEVSIEDVIPGDIILLNAGDIIPGDSLILDSKDLYVDEALLTGESFYTEKKPGIVSADAPISARSNALFMGNHVVSGTAKV
jgi:P-type Mg2+ transporter